MITSLTPRLLSCLTCCTFIVAPASLYAEQPQLQPVVEVEEEVYQFDSADNGAGPMWCGGSTCIVRTPSRLVASGLQTIPDLKPLNNCRWTLLVRRETGWSEVYVDQAGRTREPCPLVTFHDGQVFLSANPTLTAKNVYGGPARPELVKITLRQNTPQLQTILPRWQGAPPFTEHSYRSFAADGRRGELILFQNIGYDHAEWAFRDAAGNWSSAGVLKWPWGAEYDQPQPIRICYPNVMLENRAVHFCGVSDIVEPYNKWREYKKELTGREWDYDFRRLFYTWSDDITSGEFHPWIEIASRDKTCGWIRPADLWVDDQQRAHILWTERALDERLRAEFFPEARQSIALNYAVFASGKELHRRSLLLAAEGGQRETVEFARFQVTESGRLCVIYYVTGRAADGSRVSENRVCELRPDGTTSPAVAVALKRPFANFFTTTVRGGSPRSHTIDLLGMQVGQSNTISYARIRLW